MINLCLISGDDVSKRIPISKRLQPLGYDITIAGSEAPEIFERHQMDYIPYSLEREFSISKDRGTMKEVEQIFSKRPFDIVHAFDTKPTMLVPYALRNHPSIKVVRTITGLGRIFTSNDPKNLVLRQVYSVIQNQIQKDVVHTIFQNETDYELFLEKGFVQSNRASVIKGSGIDLSNFSNQPLPKKGLKEDLGLRSDTVTFILISRLVKQKGIIEYLKAARICQQAGMEFNFLLVGPIDNQKDAISKEVIDQYGDIVTYLGRRNDIKELLNISDIFVLPTYYREGVPRVLLEAAAMKLGLITTDMPGCNDVVKHEWNGLIVPIKNEQALAKSMMSLAKQPDKLERFKIVNKNHIQEFSLTNVTAAYHQLYQQLMSVPNRKPSLSFG